MITILKHRLNNKYIIKQWNKFKIYQYTSLLDNIIHIKCSNQLIKCKYLHSYHNNQTLDFDLHKIAIKANKCNIEEIISILETSHYNQFTVLLYKSIDILSNIQSWNSIIQLINHLISKNHILTSNHWEYIINKLLYCMSSDLLYKFLQICLSYGYIPKSNSLKKIYNKISRNKDINILIDTIELLLKYKQLPNKSILIDTLYTHKKSKQVDDSLYHFFISMYKIFGNDIPLHSYDVILSIYQSSSNLNKELDILLLMRKNNIYRFDELFVVFIKLKNTNEVLSLLNEINRYKYNLIHTIKLQVIQFLLSNGLYNEIKNYLDDTMLIFINDRTSVRSNLMIYRNINKHLMILYTYQRMISLGIEPTNEHNLILLNIDHLAVTQVDKQTNKQKNSKIDKYKSLKDFNNSNQLNNLSYLYAYISCLIDSNDFDIVFNHLSNHLEHALMNMETDIIHDVDSTLDNKIVGKINGKIDSKIGNNILFKLKDYNIFNNPSINPINKYLITQLFAKVIMLGLHIDNQNKSLELINKIKDIILRNYNLSTYESLYLLGRLCYYDRYHNSKLINNKNVDIVDSIINNQSNDLTIDHINKSIQFLIYCKRYDIIEKVISNILSNQLIIPLNIQFYYLIINLYTKYNIQSKRLFDMSIGLIGLNDELTNQSIDLENAIQSHSFNSDITVRRNNYYNSFYYSYLYLSIEGLEDMQSQIDNYINLLTDYLYTNSNKQTDSKDDNEIDSKIDVNNENDNTATSKIDYTTDIKTDSIIDSKLKAQSMKSAKKIDSKSVLTTIRIKSTLIDESTIKSINDLLVDTFKLIYLISINGGTIDRYIVMNTMTLSIYLHEYMKLYTNYKASVSETFEYVNRNIYLYKLINEHTYTNIDLFINQFINIVYSKVDISLDSLLFAFLYSQWNNSILVYNCIDRSTDINTCVKILSISYNHKKYNEIIELFNYIMNPSTNLPVHLNIKLISNLDVIVILFNSLSNHSNDDIDSNILLYNLINKIHRFVYLNNYFDLYNYIIKRLIGLKLVDHIMLLLDYMIQDIKTHKQSYLLNNSDDAIDNQFTNESYFINIYKRLKVSLNFIEDYLVTLPVDEGLNHDIYNHYIQSKGSKRSNWSIDSYINSELLVSNNNKSNDNIKSNNNKKILAYMSKFNSCKDMIDEILFENWQS